MAIFAQYLPEWDEDVDTTFAEISTSYWWNQEGLNLNYVIEEISSSHQNLTGQQNGDNWILSRIEQYVSSGTDCQFDFLLIARYKRIGSSNAKSGETDKC